MASKALLSAEVLRQLLRYEPETGKLFWKARPASMFPSDLSAVLWNGKWAGKEALTASNGYGYPRGEILGRSYLAHRVIWCMQTGSWPVEHVDHINRDRSCNRWDNLREASRSENSCNRASKENSTSQFLGVSWAADRKKWVARISEKNGYRHLGTFNFEKAAALAYDDAARISHGKFARLNFPESVTLAG